MLLGSPLKSLARAALVAKDSEPVSQTDRSALKPLLAALAVPLHIGRSVGCCRLTQWC